MNLTCPDCGSLLAYEVKCPRCNKTYDETAGSGPDPWEIAGGLDLRAEEDRRVYASEQHWARRHWRGAAA